MPKPIREYNDEQRQKPPEDHAWAYAAFHPRHGRFIGTTNQTLAQTIARHYVDARNLNSKMTDALNDSQFEEWEWTILTCTSMALADQVKQTLIELHDTFANGLNSTKDGKMHAPNGKRPPGLTDMLKDPKRKEAWKRNISRSRLARFGGLLPNTV